MASKATTTMTPEQIIKEMQSTSLLNQVRQTLSAYTARMEQQEAQRNPPDIMEIRNMEFETARKIIKMVLAHG